MQDFMANLSAELITVGIGALILGASWLVCALSKIALVSSSYIQENFSWKELGKGFVRVCVWMFALLGFVTVLELLTIFAQKVDLDITGLIDDASTLGVIGVVLTATTQYVVKAYKNIKQFLLGDEDSKIDVSQAHPNYQEIATKVYDFFQVPKGLKEAQKDAEEKAEEEIKSGLISGGLGTYYNVPYDTYDAFRNAVLGRGFDIDGAYDFQCLTKDHAILMADGSYKFVQDIEVGDEVLASDGKTINRVVSANTKIAPVGEVNTHTGYIRGTLNHRVCVDGEFVEIKDLKRGDIIEEAKVEGINLGLTPNEYKMFGFWLGDGWKHYRWANSTKATIGVRVCTPADEAFIKSLDIAGLSFKNDGHGYAMFTAETKEKHPKLCEAIYNTNDKTIPILSEGYAEIIEGFNQADGSKTHAHGHIRIVNTNKLTLLSLQYGARQLGWQAKISRPLYRDETNYCSHPKPIWVLSINRNPARNKVYGKVLSFTDLEEEDTVYVINVDGDHTYIADNLQHHNCWDGAALLWQQIGRWLSTGGTGCARGCWTVARDENAGDDFELIYDSGSIKRGDVVVFGMGTYGHIGYADEDYNGGSYISLLGQNQGGSPKGTYGAGFNVVNVSMATFLGAFRLKQWKATAPAPTPTPSKKVKYTYKAGDTFGQVILNLGLNTSHGLWGPDGDVAYYTEQLHEQGIYGNIPIGTTITLTPRKN